VVGVAGEAVVSASEGARAQVLGRILAVLGTRDVPAPVAYRSIERGYQATPTLDEDRRIALFVERLQHYQVGVYRCELATLRRAIGDTLANRRMSRPVIPADLPREWLPPDLEVVEDRGLSYVDLDLSEGVITGCSLAIAATGTIVLRHAAGEGRRALTLVPDYHLCVVSTDQIVQTVPEAIRRLAAWRPALVTTISGPSATADIEMTRIRGVHGPRTLDVIVCGS
jgi:L-lactate dehydrogenase complex protein LldG